MEMMIRTRISLDKTVLVLKPSTKTSFQKKNEQSEDNGSHMPDSKPASPKNGIGQIAPFDPHVTFRKTPAMVPCGAGALTPLEEVGKLRWSDVFSLLFVFFV